MKYHRNIIRKKADFLLLNILLAIMGFALLLKGADLFVDGAASLAKNFKIPTVVIGLTIVAFGTSAPELAISFSSHLSGNPDMLFGNVIGSNISNIFVILGITALLIPIKLQDSAVKKEIPLLLLVTAVVSILFLDMPIRGASQNALTRPDAVILLLLFCFFCYYLITIIKSEQEETAPKYNLPIAIFFIIIGLVGIIFGSDLVVNNASRFAESIGISQKVIAVTIISIGTSLPELVTAITAVRKGENNMAIGSIVGSNIFNICIVLGLPVVILGEAYTTAFGTIDIAFMLLAAIMLWVFSYDRKIKRYEAVVFMAIYIVYVGYVVMQ